MSFNPGGTLIQGTAGFSKDDLQLASYRNSGGTVSVAVVGPDGAAISVSSSSGTINTGTMVLTSGGTVVGTGNPYPVTLQTLIAGEDLTNDVQKVENRYSYTHVSAVGTTVIKASAGFLHSINVGVSSAGGQIVVYDSASGTNATRIAVIGTTTTPEPLPTYFYNVTTSSGIVIANVGTQTYTVSYR
jgi:hypothetical protein